ncbi:MAG: hypothetical protein KC713_02400, partial [Candidatus Omnitrophica bacterium]|nr:hypothetical protein [Candidatus Omnitrophota bacterium]
LTDFVSRADFFFKDKVVLDESAQETLQTNEYKEGFQAIAQKLQTLENFQEAMIETTIRETLAEKNLKTKDYIKPLRAVLTGKTVGASLFRTVELIGKEKTIERLQSAI